MTSRMPLARNETGDRFEVEDGQVATYDATTREWYGGPGGGGGAIDPLTLTFYVDQGYAGGDSDGSIAKPFLTVQDAVDEAAGEPVTVYIVATGAPYIETVTTLSNVSLVGMPMSASQSTEDTPFVVLAELILSRDEFCSVRLQGMRITTGISLGLSNSAKVFAKDSWIEVVEAGAEGVITVELDASFLQTFDGLADSATLVAKNGSVVGGGLTQLGTFADSEILGITAETITARDCDMGDVSALSASFDNCLWTLESTLQQSGASGGGAAHANPPFRFVGCTFTSAISLESQGGGESFDVIMDQQSYQSFWSGGGSTTGVRFMQESQLLAINVYAVDDTNTVDSSADALYKAISGAAFIWETATPFSPGVASASVTYSDAYVGSGSPPQSPPARALLTVRAGVVSATGGTVGCAINVDGDVTGAALTDRTHGNARVDVAAGAITEITAQRIVDLPLAGNTVLEPAFASDSGDDLTIDSLTFTCLPINNLPGW